jgi:hypothetical protein
MAGYLEEFRSAIGQPKEFIDVKSSRCIIIMYNKERIYN